MPSEAGYSSVSFTSGNVHVTDADPPCAEDFPYQSSGSTRSGVGITGVCGTPPGLPGAGTVDCTGTLTATFTFVPEWANEEPPPYAVVYELSEASCVGDSGDCANGLGHPAVPPIGFAKTSMGERWTLRANPGSSFSITVTPSASSVWATGVCGESEGEASVSYTAECYPVYVKLEGTLKVYAGSVPGQTSYAKHECMIGQQVMATLVCPGWPDNTRSWAVEGGNPFADYQVAPPDGDSASLLLYSQGQTGQYTTAIFRESGAAKFQCTAFLGGPIQQQVTVKGDMVTVTPEDAVLEFELGDVKLGYPMGALWFGLLDADPLFGEYQDEPAFAGIRYRGRFVTPVRHRLGPYVGGWHFVQLVSPGRFRLNWGNWQNLLNNGIQGLDLRYPTFPEPPGFPPPRYPATTIRAVGGDGPGQPLLSIQPSRYRTDGETMKVYAMYEPPARDGLAVRWVPLQVFSWGWGGEVWWDVTHWAGPSPKNAWATFSQAHPPHPQWSLRHHAGNLVWIP